MRTLAITLLAIVMATSLQARAGVIAHDLEAPGDGLLTYDTINRREWLDLPATAGVTLAEVMSQMAPGGRLEDFRFATLVDVSDLAASAEVGWTTWSLPFNSEPHAPELVELLGSVVRFSAGGGPDIVLGLIASDNTSSVSLFDDTNFHVVSMLVESLSVGPNGPALVYTPRGGVFASAPIPWSSGFVVGVGDIGPFWLYRAVPEPGAALLLLQAGAGMIAVRYRRGGSSGRPPACIKKASKHGECFEAFVLG